MGHRILVSCAAALLAVMSTFAQSAPQAEARKAPAAQDSGTETAAYSETPDGLKKLLQNVFAAEKTGDTAKSEQLYASMAIPDHAAWFVKTFGEAEGARLEAKYVSSWEVASAGLKKSAQMAVQQNRTFLNVQVFEKPMDTSIALTKAVLAAMTNRVAIYDAGDSTGPEDKSPYFFGNFVYANGVFRYLDIGVMRALSSAPPMRVRIGGNVQRAKLIHKVDPVYPADARLEGTVKLHVIIADDGSVQHIEVVSGHPLLVPATLDAVRQWRYEPTTLNGDPVEVDTEVDVFFAQRR